MFSEISISENIENMILLDDEKISSLKKYAFSTILSVIILSSTFPTVQHNLNTDSNVAIYDVADYLAENYTFGYATFSHANVITYLTNGDVEVGNLKRIKKDVKEYLNDTYKYDAWLTPERYYTYNHAGHIFLLVSREELTDNENHPTIQAGKMVYNDDHYVVFDYDSHEAFKDSFVTIPTQTE